MELVVNNCFYEMTQEDMTEIDGGGVVESVVNGISNIWDSWCGIWYEAGKHVYNWTH